MLSVIGDTLFYTLLIETYCAQPLLHVEAGACLLCHLVVPYDAHLGVAGVEGHNALSLLAAEAFGCP